jgi:hypothetical protein
MQFYSKRKNSTNSKYDLNFVIKIFNVTLSSVKTSQTSLFIPVGHLKNFDTFFPMWLNFEESVDYLKKSRVYMNYLT